jgi:hypothetical protein
MLCAGGAVHAQDAAPAFGCEVRYNFREALPGSRGKRFSAPDHEREALPLSAAAANGAGTVTGSVPHLPYQFEVRLSRENAGAPWMLTVDIRQAGGGSLPGYPRSAPSTLTPTGDGSRIDFPIPVSKQISRQIERTLLGARQKLMNVSLIIGMDADFLSGSFPR